MKPLTMQTAIALPLTQLASIALNTAFAMEERRKAAGAIHARAGELNGGNWLALSLADKKSVRDAMALEFAAVA